MIVTENSLIPNKNFLYISPLSFTINDYASINGNGELE